MRPPPRAVRALATAAWALLACSSYREVARERCPPLFGFTCGDAYEAYFANDPEGARAAYRAHVRRLAASCEEFGAAPSSGGEARGKPQTSDDDAPPSESPAAAGSAAPGGDDARYARCTVVAALRAHATRIDLLRELRVPAGHDPEALPADWDGALRTLRAICLRGRGRGGACELLTTFEAAERGEQGQAHWFEGPVREVVVAALVERLERLPADDDAGRGALLQRINRMTLTLGDVRYGGASASTERLLERVAAARAAASSGEADRAVTALEAAAAREDFDPTSREAGALVQRVRERLAGGREGDAATRARVRALAARAADAVVRRATARQEFLRGLDALEVLSTIDPDGVTSPSRDALRAAGGQFHAEQSARHLAAGRPGAAWLHGTLGAALGVPGPLDAARSALAPLVPAAAFVLRFDAAGCPWAAPSLAAPPAGAPAVEVELRWTRCESNERRWNSQEQHTVTVREEQTRRVQRQRLVGAYNCGPLERYCTNRTGHWENVTEEVTETVPVERVVTDDFAHRELTTGASAEATLRFEGRAVNASWSETSPPIAEVQTTSGLRPQRFSATTLDDQRRAVRRSLSAWLGPDGGARRALAGDVARRLVEDAAARVASSPDEADELFARAYFLTRAEADPRARQHFMGRCAVSEERLRAAVER